MVFQPDFLSAEEERELLAPVEQLDFEQITMRGQTARRTVRHFGYDYDYEAYGKLLPGEAISDWLLPVRDRCADLAELEAGELAQALVSRYPPGAPIGWHKDAPMFGAKVVGVSLAAGSRMRFQRTVGDVRHVYELELPPRSAYVIGGKARSTWQHSIPPVKELRYSITFRTVRARSCADDG